MDSGFRPEISDTADPQDQSDLQEALFAFNRQATGYSDGRALSCFLRDEDGRLVAGLDGFTWGGYARVEYVWVDEPSRGRGLGHALMTAAISEAAARGCVTMVLDTHTFQAPRFYERLGFTEVGRTLDTPVGHDQILYQRRLLPSPSTSSGEPPQQPAP